jgi:cytochrome c556
MKGRITKLGAVALAGAIGFATMAAADPITDRREVMKANGAAMKAISEILKANGSAADMAPHAAKLTEDAGKLAPLFPAGSDQPQGKDPGQTMAKAEIWQNPDDFAAKLKAFGDEAAMLNTAVAGGDMAAISAEFEKVGGTCGACHKAFRAK